MIKAKPRSTIAPRAARRAPVIRQAPRQAATVAGAQVHLGTLVSWDATGPVVDFEGNPRGPTRARVSTTSPGVRSGWPAAVGQDVVLLVDPRPSRPPVLLGLLRPFDAPAPGDGELDAHVDGRRIELEGRDEIVLRCGEASITLRRNGRILIRGVEVETRARGVNRIKGGSVAIN